MQIDQESQCNSNLSYFVKFIFISGENVIPPFQPVGKHIDLLQVSDKEAR